MTADAPCPRCSEGPMASLHLAALHGHVQCARALLLSGADVQEEDNRGRTALHHAAAKGFAKCVRILLASGAEVNALSQKEDTPLILAARGWHCYNPLKICTRYAWEEVDRTECVKLLIERGADVNMVNRKEETALWGAVLHFNPNVITLLVDAGANVRYTRESGETLLHLSVYLGRDADVIKFLVELGADVNAKSEYGSTPLHCAVQWNCLDVVKELLKSGADATAREENGETPLHYTANRCPDIARVLVKEGADVNATTDDGRTALHNAAHFGDINVLDVLLGLGAELQVVDARGWTVMHFAATSRAGWALVRWLAQKGAPVDVADEHGVTPLHVAVAEGEETSVWALLKLRPSLTSGDSHGRSALHVAALGTSEGVVRALLEGGADRRATDVDGNTAMQLATEPRIRRMLQYWALAG